MSLPVLILTARGDEIDTVVGLDAADDYVTKPFRLAELLSRVRRLLLRTHESPQVGDRRIRVDRQAHRDYLDGGELSLTTKEFHLLSVLDREEGCAVSRKELVVEVWDAPAGAVTKTLDMHISILRQKLDDDVHEPRHIFTVRGIGFRFQNDPRPMTRDRTGY